MAIFLVAAFHATLGLEILSGHETEAIALRGAELVIANSPITKDDPARRRRSKAAGIIFKPAWRPDRGRVLLGVNHKAPLRKVRVWEPNSVGGINGNRWSWLGVFEVLNKDSAIDRLAGIVL